MSRFQLIAVTAVLAFGTLVSVGCEQTPEQKLNDARSMLINEKTPGEAEKLLKQVLEKRPDSMEAKRLLAGAYVDKKEFSRAEQKLQKLWEAHDLGNEEKEFSPAMKTQRSLIRDEFKQLYKSWGESLDPGEKPEKYKEVVQKGLDRFPEERGLNELLVEYYKARAEKLEKENKPVEAAKQYEKIPELHLLPAAKKEARQKAHDLRYQAHKEKARSYFKENAKSELVEQGKYDEENEMFKFEVEKKVNPKLDPEKDKHRAAAKKLTARKLAKEIKKTVIEASGLSSETDFSKIRTPEELEIKDETFEKGVYKMKAQLPLDALLRIGFELKQRARKKQNQEE